MKIVINRCFGGFNISVEALKELVKRNAKCIKTHTINEYYGSNMNEWLRDYTEYKDIGDGFMAHKYGFNVFKDNLLYSLWDGESYRANKDLVEVVEILQDKANGECAELEIFEIPDDINWHIEEYDGLESIHENHRQWG